jgi:type IV pilus assembly protein PilC
MSLYSYQGKTSMGKQVKGNIEAANETEARVKLRAQRIIPVRVIEKSAMNAAGASKNSDIFAMLGLEPKVKSKSLQIFTRQFSTLINSGIPIVQAIDILYKQAESVALKSCLLTVKGNLEKGKTLAESITGWPKIFDRLYVSLVAAGEEGGVLDTILQRLATYIEKSNKLKGKVVGAMWYPAGIITVSALVITLLLTFVIPKFEVIFKSAGQDLPPLTMAVITASHLLGHYLPVFIIAGIVGIVALKRYYTTPSGRETIDTIAIQIPIFGTLIQRSAIARFTRTMSTMLSAGVSIIDTLEICSNVVGNAVVEKAIIRCKAAISEGKSMTQPLSQEVYIPAMVVQMIGVGETTGNLDTMLSKIADFYDEEVDAAVGALTSLMEPLMMVVLGGIIAVIVVAMYLPIFQMAGAATK